MTDNIETLNLDDFDINDIALDSIIEENFKNTLFSHPFYSCDNFEYEFRVTFSEDTLILDEIKYNDLDDFEDCIKLTSNVLREKLETLKPFILNNIDIRDKKTLLEDDVLHIIDKSSDNFDLLLEENKKVVLKSIYEDLKEIMVI